MVRLALRAIRRLLRLLRRGRRRRHSALYRRVLASPEWRRKARAWKEAEGWRCERCPSWSRPRYDLACHHKHYRTLGMERREDCEILCPRHHRAADRRRRRYARPLSF